MRRSGSCRGCEHKTIDYTHDDLYMSRRAIILTDSMIETITDLIRRNVPRDIAAQSIGISTPTFYAWMTKGERGDPRYRKFYERVMKADAEGSITLIQSVSNADDWRAAQWLLSKKHRVQFGDEQKPEEDLSGDGSSSRVVFVTRIPNEEMKKKQLYLASGGKDSETTDENGTEQKPDPED